MRVYIQLIWVESYLLLHVCMYTINLGGWGGSAYPMLLGLLTKNNTAYININIFLDDMQFFFKLNY